MLSKTNQYAIRAVLYLAQTSGGQPVRASQVAEGLGVPSNYLSKILHALTRAGVLRSERGPRGGFCLARPPESVSLSDVIAPFDADPSQRSCLLGRSECSDELPCRVHDSWKVASEPVIRFFNETRISDLLGGASPCG